MQERGSVGDGEEREERIGHAIEKGSERVEMTRLKDSRRIVTRHCGIIARFVLFNIKGLD